MMTRQSGACDIKLKSFLTRESVKYILMYLSSRLKLARESVRRIIILYYTRCVRTMHGDNGECAAPLVYNRLRAYINGPKRAARIFPRKWEKVREKENISYFLFCALRVN